jgi:hypothetical protein
MPLIAAASVAALFTADASVASPSSVRAAFGNTVVSTYPDGRTGLLWLKADGTYNAMGRRRTPSSGTWSVKGEKVCLKQRKPRAAPIAYCTKFPNGGVGASWQGRAVTGEKITIKLVQGRVSP